MLTASRRRASTSTIAVATVSCVEIVDFLFFVEGGLAIALVGAVARALRCFPLHGPDEARAPEGARRAVRLCFALAALSALVCIEVERRNLAAGDLLPLGPHPRGWSYEPTRDEFLSSVAFVTSEGKRVPLDDPQTLAIKRRAAEARNHLHALVEGALALHALVPLTLVWTIYLAGSRLPSRSVRALAAALVVPLVACLVTMTRLRLYDALRGD